MTISSNEGLLGFFTWIQCSLDENNMIPRVIYQNHLLKVVAYVLHHHQPYLRSEDQWFSWNFQNDSDHWIFHCS